MSGRRSLPSDNLLLIAATTILVLTAQRYFQSSPLRKSDPPPANLAGARSDNLVDEISQPGHGRLSSTPLQIPRAGWRDILWRTYERAGEDR